MLSAKCVLSCTYFCQQAYYKQKGHFMDSSSYVPVTGTVLSISQMTCCNQIVSLRTSEGIINFVISPDTYVVDSTPLRAGMRVTGFYDANRPVPLIYPPRYQAEILTIMRADEQVLLRFFDNNLVASDRSLKLNTGRQTTIVTANGQRFTCNPGNHVLIVYYSNTTRSIPPQTTPRKIIVMC